MQTLYQYLLTSTSISSDDAQLITLIENSLGEYLVEDPVSIQIPMSGRGAS